MRFVHPLLSLILLGGLLHPVAAQEAPASPANAFCPVMPEEPVEADRWVDYQGRRIWFCCGKCVKSFLAKPEDYLAALPPLAVPGAPAVPATADAQTPASVPVAVPELAKPVPVHAPGQPLWRWLSRWHVVLVHFPIACLVLAALAEWGAWLMHRPQWRGVARWQLLVGTAAALLAAGTGLLAEEFTPGLTAAGAAVERHEVLGLATAGLALLCAVWGALGATRDPWRLGYRLALLLLAGLVAATGHYGGILVHGANHLDWPGGTP